MSCVRASRLLPLPPALAARCAAVLMALPLIGCAATVVPTGPAPQALFDDAQFMPPAEPLAADEVLRMSAAMLAYLHDTIEPAARRSGLRQALIDALYTRSRLQLEYESSLTRNAAQAFEARQGNCLSLVLMTGAFARAMGLGVTYQQVAGADMWSRSGGMYFSSGHVNLRLERRVRGLLGHDERRELYTVDFMPGEDRNLSARPLAEATVLAMYMNNRAAEAMVAGRLDDAYWRAREALRLDPGFAGAYNTLGVVYLRHGDAQRAEQALRVALDAAPDNPQALANEASALHQLGREAQARAVREHLARVEPTPPFYWYERGQAALRAGDFEAARGLFLKELQRAPDYHEFHYALAAADFGLGRLDEARGELALALRDAVRRSDHDLYAAKLDKLRSVPAQPAGPTAQ